MQHLNADFYAAPTPLRTFIIAAAALVWVLGLAYGMQRLYAFESSPGKTGLTPSRWPVGTVLSFSPSMPTLVMFIHPQCSCTRASLSELRELLGAIRHPVNTRIVFVQEADAPASETWRDARSIPGVSVSTDPTGDETARFGALTSGFSVAYDTSGALIFSGGITSARGHAGESMGRRQLIRALESKASSPARHAVFGCPLPESGTAMTRFDHA